MAIDVPREFGPLGQRGARQSVGDHDDARREHDVFAVALERDSVVDAHLGDGALEHGAAEIDDAFGEGLVEAASFEGDVAFDRQSSVPAAGAQPQGGHRQRRGGGEVRAQADGFKGANACAGEAPAADLGAGEATSVDQQVCAGHRAAVWPLRRRPQGRRRSRRRPSPPGGA